MGREYIHEKELRLERCPYCGSNTFRITVGRKVEAVEKWVWNGGGYEVIDGGNEEVDWEVIYGVSCADCGENLWEIIEEEVGV
jgi:DNA-directed RNA polymerase subunit RPC12/RpoP